MNKANKHPMHIKKIEVYQCNLPYSGGVYELSDGRAYSKFDATFVRIITNTDIDGWGESTPFGANYIAAHARGVRAGIAEIAPHLIGENPCLVDRLNDKMDAVLCGHLHAKAPIDIACWDIFGKSVNMPVCDLLGGRTQAVLPVISSIPANTPDIMRANVATHRQKGFLGHSIKIGATANMGGAKLDAERITACLSDSQPDEFFLVDVNGGLTAEQILRLINLLPSGLDFVLEAPCSSWHETISLRKRCPYPIYFDELVQSEEDIILIIANDVADGIGLKLSKNGGLTRARRQRDICTAAGLCMTIQDTIGSTVSFAAITHLGQSVKTKLLRCVLDVRSMVDVQTADFNAPIENGGVKAPDAPGLGIKVHQKLLGKPVAVYQ